MAHGDKKKRKIVEKERRNNAPPSRGRCVLCGKDTKIGPCPSSPNGHIVI